MEWFRWGDTQESFCFNHDLFCYTATQLSLSDNRCFMVRVSLRSPQWSMLWLLGVNDAKKKTTVLNMNFNLNVYFQCPNKDGRTTICLKM